MKSVYFRFTSCAFTILLCITAVSQTVECNAIGDTDHDLFRYIHEDMKNEFLDFTTKNIQRMGEFKVYIGTCILLCAFGDDLSDERMLETGKLASTAFVEAGFAIYALKKIIRRPRPEDESERDSFPSGHAAFAFAMATVAGHEYIKLRIPLYIGAFGTAFSRVYLGRHYPSDVIAGAVIGTLVGLHVIRYREPVLKLSF